MNIHINQEGQIVITMTPTEAMDLETQLFDGTWSFGHFQTTLTDFLNENLIIGPPPPATEENTDE